MKRESLNAVIQMFVVFCFLLASVLISLFGYINVNMKRSNENCRNDISYDFICYEGGKNEIIKESEEILRKLVKYRRVF